MKKTPSKPPFKIKFNNKLSVSNRLKYDPRDRVIKHNRIVTKPKIPYFQSKSCERYDLNKANWDVTKPNKPSLRLSNIKFSDPFLSSQKHATNFGYVYSAGGIPVRIEHGNVKMKLKWDIDPEFLDYDPTLIICFEGLLETKHPYNFAAKQCVRELLLAPRAAEKVKPMLQRLINPLRAALTSNNPEVFLEAMCVTEALSGLVKEELNPYLHFFLQMINKRSFNINYKERVFDLLRVLESNGGEDALKIIKLKIPTYVSCA
ncbi:MAG: parkin coregulated gene family protein [archaeon]|nr:parkin coregulated gene family protein [archaeon]